MIFNSVSTTKQETAMSGCQKGACRTLFQYVCDRSLEQLKKDNYFVLTQIFDGLTIGNKIVVEICSGKLFAGERCRWERSQKLPDEFDAIVSSISALKELLASIEAQHNILFPDGSKITL